MNIALLMIIFFSCFPIHCEEMFLANVLGWHADHRPKITTWLVDFDDQGELLKNRTIITPAIEVDTSKNCCGIPQGMKCAYGHFDKPIGMVKDIVVCESGLEFMNPDQKLIVHDPEVNAVGTVTLPSSKKVELVCAPDTCMRGKSINLVK